MGFMDLFKSSPKDDSGGGDIGYYGLTDWWTNTFSSNERAYIVSKYQPMGIGSGNSNLVSGNGGYLDTTVVAILHGLAGWFSKKEDRTIAHRMFDESEARINSNTPILELHFLYNQEILIYYKDRADQIFFDKAVDACKKQIEISSPAMKAFKKEYGDFLPSHRGFKQLAIIYEKQKRYEEAIQLCERAQRDGWNDDWQKRIARCQKKAKKLTS